MAQTWQKKEREQKKQQHKKVKEEKRLERKKQSAENGNAAMVMAYVDENGNLSATPPDYTKRKKINSEDIQIGVPKQSDLTEETVHTGIVIRFNEAKGYGFIKDTQTQQEYFVHINSMQDNIKEKAAVSFAVEKSPKGLAAVNVALLKL
ncbi:MAG: DNA-binding protein [Chitinophaga sp.]|jgi:cold shock CspA family protein|nr:DNA-binding protein [Chitinophaga sp.]